MLIRNRTRVRNPAGMLSQVGQWYHMELEEAAAYPLRSWCRFIKDKISIIHL
jgi:hypothetical protein